MTPYRSLSCDIISTPPPDYTISSLQPRGYSTLTMSISDTCSVPGKVVETWQIRQGITEEIRKEYYEIILAIHAILDRDERVAIFKDKLQGLSDEAQHHMELIYGREEAHITFANEAYPVIYQEFFNKTLATDRKPHDYSKDELFKFILASNFDCGVGHESLPKMATEELKRHYRLEPHHPEHEDQTGFECTKEDILEMAVDRMARNIQFNKGSITMDKMSKFMPKFILGDVDSKLAFYWQCVERFKDRVVELSGGIFD